MIIVKTPLRISFAGGGSDIPQFYKEYGGATLSTAINRHVYVMVSSHFHPNQIRVSYSKTENVGHYNELEHTRVKEIMRHLKIPSGVEIVTIADIPSKGTGLGSSSSFTVGLLKALYAYLGKALSEKELAEEACLIEIDFLKEPIGRQDQYIASFGGFKFIDYQQNGQINVSCMKVRQEVLKSLEDSLLLIYTNIQRSTKSVLQHQIEGFKNKKNIQSLKQMVEFARIMKKDLEQAKLQDFGRMLHESWMLKKSLASNISHSEIDIMYESALKAGALGGKLLGAGGGGFLMLYAPPERHESIKKMLPNYLSVPVKFDTEGSKILFTSKSMQNI